MTKTDGPAPLSLAIWPSSLDDGQRLARGLRQLTGDDPFLRVKEDSQTGEVVIGATSEPHLEVLLERLTLEFGVEATVGRPKVRYTQRLTVPGEGEMKYARRRGGRGHYAHVRLRLHPREAGAGYVFENCIAGGSIPEQFIKSVEEGVKDTLAHGVVAHYPIDDVRVELYDGSYHDVDSSATAFKIAAALASWIAVREARPILFEPVMPVKVLVPAECLRETIRHLSGRRGVVHTCEDCTATLVVQASVPLAELFGYASDLAGRTRGRGTCVIAFERYQPLRGHDADGDRDSLVGAPLRHVPTLGASGIALPEPDDDWTCV